MAINYNKLWKLLIDLNMKKKDLRNISGISTNAMAKLGKNERVGTDVIDRICLSLKCNVEDIMEVNEVSCEVCEKKKNDFNADITLSLAQNDWGRKDYRPFVRQLMSNAQEKLPLVRPLDSNFSANPIQVIDFFCGAGGTSLGFAAVNEVVPAFHFLGGCDVNKVSATTYSHNFGTKMINEDIVEISNDSHKLQNILESIGYDENKPTVMIGCAPCQGFSSHRKKNWGNGEDVRNSLIMSFVRIVSRLHPDVIIMENVPEFLSKKYWKYFSAAQKDYQSYGYTVKGTIYNAASFGVPQERFRSIIMAMKKNFVLPPILLEPDKYRTVRETIGHLPHISSGSQDKYDSLHKSVAHKQSTLDVIKSVPHDGGNRPSGVGPKCLDKVAGFYDVYGRLFWDKPAITMTHYARNPASGRFVHPEQDRGLTAREVALLQSFPVGFEFIGKSDDIYRQIGEAVPPMLSVAIAANILIELISCQPSEKELKNSPTAIESPVSNSYSSVIVGIKKQSQKR